MCRVIPSIKLTLIIPFYTKSDWKVKYSTAETCFFVDDTTSHMAVRHG